MKSLMYNSCMLTTSRAIKKVKMYTDNLRECVSLSSLADNMGRSIILDISTEYL